MGQLSLAATLDITKPIVHSLLVGIEGMRFFSRERLPSRDELHDRP